MNAIMEERALSELKERCVAKSARLTQQRKNVFDLLINAQQALSAYELTKIYNSRFERKIIATSVYRILEFFIELKLAYRLDTINKFVASKHFYTTSKYHFPIFVICIHCNNVDELSVPSAIMQNMQTLASTPHFTVVDSKIELKAFCNQCQCPQNHTEEDKNLEQTFKH